ncbi:MAG: hypothetical protein R3E14_00970 [Erythrobacter sp.]
MWHRHREGSLDPAYADSVWSHIERDVLPVVGKMMMMNEITPPKVLMGSFAPHFQSSRRFLGEPIS